MMIRPTERVRCVERSKSFTIGAKSLKEFQDFVKRHYANYSIVFTGIKARIEPFSVYRTKLTWRKI